MNYQIEGMTMAISSMAKMLAFYTNVFRIQFEEKEMFDTKLYAGVWGGLDLLFCPAELAQNTATQNRHQFDIVVSNLEETIKLCVEHGGILMGPVTEEETTKSIGIYDPDRNSILFKEMKSAEIA